MSALFEIDVETFGVGGELRVNDVPVLTIPEGRVETRFDVNLHVRTGTNTLGLHLGPERGALEFPAGAHCRVTLSERDGPEVEEAEPRAALEFEPREALSGFRTTLSAAPVLRRLAVVALQRFELTTPFGPWSWTSGEAIVASEALRAEVIETFVDIHRMLEAGDADALLELCAGQAADYRDAYGLPDLEVARGMIGIRETLNTPDLVVEPLADSLLTLQILGDGRLVRVLDDQGRSPLRLGLVDQPEVSGRFNVTLARSSGGWVIAR